MLNNFLVPPCHLHLSHALMRPQTNRLNKSNYLNLHIGLHNEPCQTLIKKTNQNLIIIHQSPLIEKLVAWQQKQTTLINLCAASRAQDRAFNFATLVCRYKKLWKAIPSASHSLLTHLSSA